MLSKAGHAFSNSLNHQEGNFVIDEVDQMSESEFKELLYHLFKQQGYLVNLPPKSDNLDADLVLRKGKDVIIVQAKRNTANVGVSAINAVVGANGYDNATNKWVVTNRYYTKAAINQAHKNKVKLFNRDDFLIMLKDYRAPKSKWRKAIKSTQHKRD
ncbi:restriction endonuclease [Aquibacillus albus]|uniref:HJR/Mrr/RecB family endonuclease n=1 Tax=Aquibacillus albus TaxID=1168171 RepID=A0ABS2MY30_9BACI|nr:restriction endonuclease [Aquibacillus albus]MBM7570713.1 HJR/Mrr/RecB family endonuclease [Aquibacillus albus]